MASKYILKGIHGLIFEFFNPGTTYNVQVIIKGNLLLDDCMQGFGTTYGILYVWRKYSVQITIEGNPPFNNKPESYSQGSQDFFFESRWLKNTGCGLDSRQINIPIVLYPSSLCLLKTS